MWLLWQIVSTEQCAWKSHWKSLIQAIWVAQSMGIHHAEHIHKCRIAGKYWRGFRFGGLVIFIRSDKFNSPPIFDHVSKCLAPLLLAQSFPSLCISFHPEEERNCLYNLPLRGSMPSLLGSMQTYLHLSLVSRLRGLGGNSLGLMWWSCWTFK